MTFLAYIYCTIVIDSDEHSSLLVCKINNGCKNALKRSTVVINRNFVD
jgi:hypothetical protein